jgi:uncharacterized cupredoxin-like copper-binding protein
MRKLSIFAVVAALSLGAAACGDDDDEDGAAATTSTQPAATPTATTPSKGRSAVTISATDFKFSPSDPTVKAGQATFTLRNDGQAPHALEIEGNGVEEETDTIQPGQTANLKVDLKPGTYEIYCPVDNHKQLGMEGELKVE